MCIDNQPIDEDSEVIKVISEHREGMVTHMINTKGFQKASIQLHMSPLSVTDIFDSTIDDDDTAAKEHPRHIRRLLKHPHAPAYVASNEETQYNTKTETNDDSEVEKSQVLNKLPETDNSETTTTTRRDHESLFANDEDESQNFEGHIPSSNLVSKQPKLRRKSMRKRSEHPIPAAIVQQ